MRSIEKECSHTNGQMAKAKTSTAKHICIALSLWAKIQRTFIRNPQQLSCCFNLRGLRLLLWHKKIAWQQIYKEQNKMLLFRLGNSFQKNYDSIRKIKNTPFLQF